MIENDEWWLKIMVKDWENHHLLEFSSSVSRRLKFIIFQTAINQMRLELPEEEGELCEVRSAPAPPHSLQIHPTPPHPTDPCHGP